jgi:transcriptional regulator NrdR family protein
MPPLPSLERRRSEPKLQCPNCGSWLSYVLPRRPFARGRETFVRHRQCDGCLREYETEERVTKLLPDKKPQHVEPKTQQDHVP